MKRKKKNKKMVRYDSEEEEFLKEKQAEIMQL